MGKNKYYCKIDGKIYNLKKIQDIIDENPEHPDIAKIYIAAVEEYHLPTNTMLDSVITFNNNEIPADYNEALKRMQEYNQASLPKSPPKPRCPRCGSTDIKEEIQKIGINIVTYDCRYRCYNCYFTFFHPN
ncbi:hypothetical protein, partial [[Clostridium] hylemonae]|uniref:hypothetical protein n=1 Tax=[Clostridium] hylemonae TaxID=89153 RepID=UPI001FAA8BB0